LAWPLQANDLKPAPDTSVKIIHRYVLREHVGPFFFSLTALTSLLLLNYIAKQIDELVGKGLTAGVIGQFFVLSIPFTVAMTTPMSVLVATLYAFSRLASENEVTAMKANGISLSRLLVPVLITASFISIGMIAFNDRVLPASNHQLRKLQGDIARKKPTFALKEQIINQVADRQVYLKAMRLSTDNRMTDVTIYDLTDVMRRRTIYADSGELAFAANGRDLILTLYKGSTLEVPRAEPTRLQRAQFERNYVRVENVANQLELTRQDSYKSDREMSVCELQNEVARYEAEYLRARNDLRSALIEVTREALYGTVAKPPDIAATVSPFFKPGSLAPRSPNASLGRAYCDLAAQVKRTTARTKKAANKIAAAFVPALYAAQAPAQSPPVPPTQQTPAVVVPPGTQDTTPVAITPAPVPRSGITQAPVILSGAIDNARLRMSENQRIVNQQAVELHKKFAISVACTVFILVGAPIALRFPRGGVGLVIGVSLVIFGIYYIGLIAGEALADKNLATPFLAMWAANILLTIVGVFLLARMGRETATTRGGDFREMLEIVRNLFRRDKRGRAGYVEAR
jgi:lipopolysaccharide export system permease protein